VRGGARKRNPASYMGETVRNRTRSIRPKTQNLRSTGLNDVMAALAMRWPILLAPSWSELSLSTLQGFSTIRISSASSGHCPRTETYALTSLLMLCSE
jgi:hypothetical protein